MTKAVTPNTETLKVDGIHIFTTVETPFSAALFCALVPFSSTFFKTLIIESKELQVLYSEGNHLVALFALIFTPH